MDWKIISPREGVSLLQEFIKLYNDKLIDALVFDSETSSLEPHTGEPIMFSFTHLETDISYSIPIFINTKLLAPGYKWKNLPANFEYLNEFCIPKFYTTEDKKREELPFKYVNYFDIDMDVLEISDFMRTLKLTLNTIPLVGHNLKFDLKYAFYHDYASIDKVKIKDDTLVLSYLTYGRDLYPRLSLKTLCKTIFKLKNAWDNELDEYIKSFRLLKDRKYNNIPTEMLGKYAALDAHYTKKLYIHLTENFPSISSNIKNHLLDAVLMFSEIENKGVYVDLELAKDIDIKYESIISKIENETKSLPTVKKLYIQNYNELLEKNKKKRKPLDDEQLDKESFKISKTLHKKTLLFDKVYYNLPPLSKTDKGNISVDKKALDKLIIEGDLSDEPKQFIQNLQNFNKIKKITTTYLDNLDEKCHNSFYFPNFNLTNTLTGRISSGWHILPKKSSIKRMFCSRVKNKGLFLSCDYSQLELRILASLSNEKTFIQSFENGEDLHSRTASFIYGKPIEDINSEERSVGKTINFAMVYQSGSKSIAESLKKPIEEIEKMMDNFFARVPNLSKWIEKQKKQVFYRKKIYTAFGRVIPLSESNFKTMKDRTSLQRKSVNYVSQSAGSDILLTSTLNLYKFIKKQNLKSLILGTVHDSVQVDVYPGELFQIVTRIKYFFERYPKLLYSWLVCPLRIDFELGTSWGSSVGIKLLETTNDGLTISGEGNSIDVEYLLTTINNSYRSEIIEITETPKEDQTFALDDLIHDKSTTAFKLKLSLL